MLSRVRTVLPRSICNHPRGSGGRAFVGLRVQVAFAGLRFDYPNDVTDPAPSPTHSMLDLLIIVAPGVAWAGGADRPIGWNPGFIRSR